MDFLWQGLAQGVQLILAGDPELRRIVALSLAVSLSATLLATLAGVPLGTALALRRVPWAGVWQAAINTGMGLPPVVVGLVVTILLWRTGPLGFLGLLYSPPAMI